MTATPDRCGSNAELSRRLIAAAGEILAAACELDQPGVANDDRTLAAAATHHDEGADDEPSWLAAARHAYRARRQRDELFAGCDLFGEPAWDILLDLTIAAGEGKRISITSACIGAAAPATTALRWLNILERHNLLRREGDTHDMRRSYVSLTSLGFARMKAYFGECGRPQSEIAETSPLPLRPAALQPAGRTAADPP